MAKVDSTTDSASVDVPVLIVGAGPTGLVLALWLTRLGVRVRLIDKTAEPGTTSRALAVQARTLEFYQQLGMAQDVVTDGVEIGAVNLWVRAKRAATVPLGNIGSSLTPFPFALIYPQDVHERMLIDKLAQQGVHVERQTELIRFTQTEQRVTATLKRVDGTEESCRATYLAGCDGARSTVRETLQVGFPGGTYSGRFYVADVEASGPVTNKELHADLDAADLLLVFPLKKAGALRLIGNVRGESGDGDSELTFQDVSPRAIEHLKLAVHQVNWFSTYKVHHRVTNHFRVANTFLLGDAAHVHSPVGGQGMNTGIGDAINLAWKLAAVIHSAADKSLLDTYETERIGFAHRLVATTDRIFTFVTAKGGFAQFIRMRIVPLVIPLLFRQPRIRQFLFHTVSQIGIRYRHSSLSEGRTNRLHAGDRLPWIKLSQGRDNFAPLTSVDWQVHFYGERAEELQRECDQLKLPLHSFPRITEMSSKGIERNAFYLIRPDGYIALIHTEPKQLAKYFTDRRISSSIRGQA